MSGRVRKIPVFRMAAYVLMIIGILLFFLTPLFIKYLKFDTDLLGILIVIVGFAVLIVGQVVWLVVRKTRSQRAASPET